MTNGPEAVAGAVSMAVGLDWVRIGGPRSRLDEVRAWMVAKFGDEFEQGRGVHLFDYCDRWPCGAQLWHSQPSEPAGDDQSAAAQSQLCFVELPGRALATVNASTRVKWVRELGNLGFRHATRMDVAVDWFGEGLDLVEAVERACVRGELVGARVWEPRRKFSGHRLTGHTVYLGVRRADGSGRFVRVYDKGLETGERPAGQWQRWEGQFMQESARMVRALLLQADDLASGRITVPLIVEVNGAPPSSGWERQAVSLALGAYDFRNVTGSRRLDRRPRALWWVRVLGVVEGIRVKSSQRRATSLARYRAYLRRQVCPTIQAAALALGESLEDAFTVLLGDGEAIRPKRCSAVVYDIKRDEYRKQVAIMKEVLEV